MICKMCNSSNLIQASGVFRKVKPDEHIFFCKFCMAWFNSKGVFLQTI